MTNYILASLTFCHCQLIRALSLSLSLQVSGYHQKHKDPWRSRNQKGFPFQMHTGVKKESSRLLNRKDRKQYQGNGRQPENRVQVNTQPEARL